MDRERILLKFDQLEEYLEQLERIKPDNFEVYKNSIKDKLSCERLLQLSIECVLDICNILVSELRLGIPNDEDDIFSKLEKRKIISKKMKNILTDMKSFRNILVHRYGIIENERVFEILSEKLGDFEDFKKEVLKFIQKN